MSERGATDNKKTGNIGPIEVYKILLQYRIENNRLLSERTTIYLAGSSILFLAFVMLNQASTISAPTLAVLRIVLPSLGIFLTILFCSFTRATTNMLTFLQHGQENIEMTPEFSYLREQGIAPETDGWDFISEKKEWKLQSESRNTKIWLVEERPKRRCWARCLYCMFKNLSRRWLPLTFGILWVTSLVVVIVASYSSPTPPA
jgi:hypothetical protein